MHDFKQFNADLEGIFSWLKKELQVISTGRANPSFLDRISVLSYGTLMPINNVANISVEDPQTLRVTPWDNSQIRIIEKAIVDSNSGVSVAADDKGLRVIFPKLTTERRTELAKVVKQKAEEAKVSVKTERNKEMEKIDKKEKDKTLSQDDAKRAKDSLQKLVEGGNFKIEEIAVQKENELNS